MIKKAIKFIKSIASGAGGQIRVFDEIENNRPGTLAEMLKKSPELASSVNSFGNTPLHVASSKGLNESISVLVDAGAPIDAKNRMEWTPLHCAAAEGRNDAVRLLLKRGASLNSVDSMGQTPLHWASVNNQLETVRILLEKGADVLARNNRGNTPLSLAKEKEHTATAEIIRQFRPKHAP